MWLVKIRGGEMLQVLKRGAENGSGNQVVVETFIVTAFG
jgi:hypothetical protein